MKSSKGKTLDLSWATELRTAANVQTEIPEGWASVPEISEDIGLKESQTRRLLKRIDDPDMISEAKRGKHRFVIYHWAKIKEIAGL